MDIETGSKYTNAEFGALIGKRGRTATEQVAAYLFACILLLVAMGVMSATIGNKRGPGLSWTIAGPVAFVCVMIAGSLVYSVSRTVLFYEHGAEMRRLLRKPVSLAYREIETFVFATTRQFVNGAYAGTALDVRLYPAKPDKRRIRLIGKYKEKGGGRLGATVFTKDFKPDEEMDRVRERITSAAAMQWVPRFERGEAIDWCGVGRLTPAGFEPKRGKKKGEIVPFEAITCSMGNGYFQLFVEGKKWPFCIVPVNGRNFYVGLHLMQLMAPEDQLSVAEGAEFAAGREERSV